MSGLDEIEELRTPLLAEEEVQSTNNEEEVEERSSSQWSPMERGEYSTYFAMKTLLPDDDWKINGEVILHGGAPVKLTKFVCFTLGAIFWLNWIVSRRENHRDSDLDMGKIWKFDGTLIIHDMTVFFLVGRVWKMRGIDHLAWLATVLGCNAFLESQHCVPWLRHSSTIWDIHCTWEWQTWVYAIVSLSVSIVLATLHIMEALKERKIVMRISEIVLSLVFFLAPVVSSPFFHFHHWFAGWLLGMHANLDKWWSQAAMAWCHGLYINGIAVYGRDPVLTCGYAYFLSWDQKCPYLDCGYESLPSDGLLLSSDQPADWRNCSDARYHP